MISIKKVGNDYKVEATGTGHELMREAACIVAGVVNSSYEQAIKDGSSKAEAEGVARFVYDVICGTVSSVMHSMYGINVKAEQPEKKPNPFTMGMDDNMFAKFMRDMKGE